MKRKIIKSLLAVVCLLCSTNVLAYDFEVNGIYYNVVSFSELTCAVAKSTSYSGDFVIPATVNYSNKTLTVVGIAYYAFENCTNLTSVVIPNSVTEIKNYAFNGCTKLATVTIEDGETTLSLGYNNYNSYDIGKGLFYDCPITTLYLGRNLSYDTGFSYGRSPFYSVKTLQEVVVGNSVTSIDDNAFMYCSGLTSVMIGNSVTSIGDWAFCNCRGLTSVTIPNSVTSIGNDAFGNCSGLESVRIGNSVTSIGSSAFCGSSLTSVTIPNSVTSIGSSAFEYCI